MSTVNPQKGGLFAALHNLADEFDTEKQAAAPTPSDPGGYQGATTHPTKDIENRGQSASEGARSSENVADVNADQGAPGVNQASDAQAGQQDSVQLNIGTQQSATGEDPSVEDDYKGGKDDPGSTHPAKTDNDSLDGHKYASIAEGVAAHTAIANAILADMANGQELTKEALAKAAGKEVPATQKEAAAECGTASEDSAGTLQPAAAGEAAPEKPTEQAAGEAPAGQSMEGEKTAGELSSLGTMLEKAARAVEAGKLAAEDLHNNEHLQAGYGLAKSLGLEKQAAQELVAHYLQNTIQDGYTDADRLGAYLTAFQKQAMDGGSPDDGEDHSQEGDDTSGANEAEGAGGETAGAAAEGGAAPMGGAPMGEDPMGGDPMGGGGESLGDMLGGGADPGGLAGGDPGMGGEPGMGAGPSQEEALTQLIAALDELGVPLEELMNAGGGPAGDPASGPDGNMPPMEGGAPAPPAMSEGMKLASAAKAFRRQGKYKFKAAEDGTPERKLRESMKSHVRELLGY